MREAFSFENGTGEGEYLRERNPDYIRERKKIQKELERLNK